MHEQLPVLLASAGTAPTPSGWAARDLAVPTAAGAGPAGIPPAALLDAHTFLLAQSGQAQAMPALLNGYLPLMPAGLAGVPTPAMGIAPGATSAGQDAKMVPNDDVQEQQPEIKADAGSQETAARAAVAAAAAASAAAGRAGGSDASLRDLELKVTAAAYNAFQAASHGAVPAGVQAAALAAAPEVQVKVQAGRHSPLPQHPPHTGLHHLVGGAFSPWAAPVAPWVAPAAPGATHG